MSSYAGESTFTLETVRDSLIEGTIYTLRWFATNSKGDGIRSDELLVALMDTPVGPTTIQKLSEMSGLTSVTVSCLHYSKALHLGEKSLDTNSM